MHLALSIAELFLRRVHQSADQPALWRRPSSNEAFQAVIWREVAEDVWRLTATLRNAGCTTGSRVLHLADSSRGWIATDLALMFLQACHFTVSTHTPRDQLQRILDHCDPFLLIVSPRLRDQLPPELKQQVIVVDREAISSGDGMAVREAAADVPGTLEEALAAMHADLRPDDACTIVYTSGTTGQPKGVVLSHANLASNALAVASAYEDRPNDRRLSFLPYSHLYGRTCDVYTWIVRGSQLFVSESREFIIRDCQQVKPTLINGVPYFFQKVLESARQRGSSPRKALGEEIRMCSSGGAPLPMWVQQAYQADGVLLLEGYGLTETSPVITVSTADRQRDGSVGQPIHGTEVRTSSDGEILVRGPGVMSGYFQDPGETEKVLRDGWFHTGDLGHLDQDGFLWITGRRKDLVVLSTGKKVQPEPLELAIAEDPLVAQVVVCGEGHKCLGALIVPDPEELRRRIKRCRLWIFSRRQALRHPTVIKWYRELLIRRLANRADFEQIGPFKILDRGFTPESGEMTAKLSLRRSVIYQNHRIEIDQMYRPQQVSGRRWWQV